LEEQVDESSLLRPDICAIKKKESAGQYCSVVRALIFAFSEAWGSRVGKDKVLVLSWCVISNMQNKQVI